MRTLGSWGEVGEEPLKGDSAQKRGLMVHSGAWAPILKDLGEKAASALGAAAGDRLVKELVQRVFDGQSARNTEPPPVPRRVSQLAVQSYLQGGLFARFEQRQVVAWAIWELSQTSKQEAEIVLRWAAAQGDPASAVDGIVAYFAKREFGIAG